MSRKYTPRRAGKRWREAAPDFILDCFDHPDTGDRYTVFFCGPNNTGSKDGSFATTWIFYMGMSGNPTHPQGIGMSGEMEAYQAMQYRYRNGHRRVRWLDLPEKVRACATRFGAWDGET